MLITSGDPATRRPGDPAARGSRWAGELVGPRWNVSLSGKS
ncbi:hypothetical protein [Micromonospora saelicesensis]|nr:hypothetical protein [Micromonospora saelicesensis]